MRPSSKKGDAGDKGEKGDESVLYGTVVAGLP